jgi:hypothetical protein
VGRISRRAADEIKRTVQIVKGLAPGAGGFALVPGRIYLAKTTAVHAQGASQDVEIYVGAKGAELYSGQTVKAYNRVADFDDDEWVYINWIGDGWEILNSVRSADASPCGVCTIAGGMVIPVEDDVDASAIYSFNPLCDGSLYLTFEWSSALTWIGTADTMTLDCGEVSPRTLTATMTVTGVDPGEVVIVLNDGSVDVATYVNHSAWQPCVPIRMRLNGYDETCPCAPWDPWCCLSPVES